MKTITPTHTPAGLRRGAGAAVLLALLVATPAAALAQAEGSGAISPTPAIAPTGASTVQPLTPATPVPLSAPSSATTVTTTTTRAKPLKPRYTRGKTRPNGTNRRMPSPRAPRDDEPATTLPAPSPTFSTTPDASSPGRRADAGMGAAAPR